MGNEVSTFAGGILTIASGLIAPSFFEACNDFTMKQAAKTNVRNGLETVVSLIVLVGTSIAVCVTCGKFEGPKKMFWATAEHTFKTVIALLVEGFITVLFIAKGMPILGHAIGLVHYFLNKALFLKDAKGFQKIKKNCRFVLCTLAKVCEESLISATRTLGVMGGGLLVGTGVVPGGPLTMIFCGIGGGFGMDIMFTLLLTKIEGRFEPYGFLKAVHDLFEGFKTTNQKEIIDSFICSVVTVILDGSGGWNYACLWAKYQGSPFDQLYYVWFQSWAFAPPKSVGTKKRRIECAMANMNQNLNPE